MRPAVGTDIPKPDDILLLQSFDEAMKAGLLNSTHRNANDLDLSGSNNRERVTAHAGLWAPVSGHGKPSRSSDTALWYYQRPSHLHRVVAFKRCHPDNVYNCSRISIVLRHSSPKEGSQAQRLAYLILAQSPQRSFSFIILSATPVLQLVNELLLVHPSKMASDEIVWQVINQQFCSYKLKSAVLLPSLFLRTN